jgi:hypothetical protein
VAAAATAERGTMAAAVEETTAASNLGTDAPDGAPPLGNAKIHSTPSRDDGVERQVTQVMRFDNEPQVQPTARR